jgi:hypothetical protein
MVGRWGPDEGNAQVGATFTLSPSNPSPLNETPLTLYGYTEHEIVIIIFGLL